MRLIAENTAIVLDSTADLPDAAELELGVTLGAVIGAHAGPGTLALFWFRDDDA